MSDNPVYLRPGRAAFNTATRFFLFLARGPKPIYAPGSRDPATLFDKDLCGDAFEATRTLIHQAGPDLIQRSYGNGVFGDSDLPHPLPTEVRHHLLSLVTVAADAAGVCTGALGGWASTAALIHLRHLFEAYAQMLWLLDGTEEEQKAKALGLTDNGRDLLRKMGTHLHDAARGNPELITLSQRYAELASKMEDDLTALAAAHSLAVTRLPTNRQAVFNANVPHVAAYPLFAALSNAGGHPSAIEPLLFYGNVRTGATVFDFNAMHAIRAYWITQCAEYFRLLLDLAAPVLGWAQWPAASTYWKALLDRLRHFLFTWLKTQGIDDALVQPCSGHDSCTSLEIYSKITLADAQDTYDQVIDQFPV